MKSIIAYLFLLLSFAGCSNAPVVVEPILVEYKKSAIFTELKRENPSDVAVINEGVQTHLWKGNRDLFTGDGEWEWVEYSEVLEEGVLVKSEVKINFIQRNVLFAFDSASVTKVAKGIIKSLPLDDADTIELDGNTDNIGSDKYNYKLGLRRANAVKNELIKLGVNKDKIEVLSNGKRLPVMSNDTAYGRQKNRRVIIRMNLKDGIPQPVEK